MLATLSPQHEFPGTSFFLHERLGVREMPCFDLRAQCSGFLYSLAVARQLRRCGPVSGACCVVGCEVHSTGIDISTDGRDVAVLFGDGAGAVMRRGERRTRTIRSDILAVRMHAEGKHAEEALDRGAGLGALRRRASRQEMLDARRTSRGWTARFVFKHAVTRMPEVLRETLDAAGVKLEDVDLFLFHQANLRINEFVAQALEHPGREVPQQHRALRQLLGGLDPDAARRRPQQDGALQPRRGSSR